LTKLRAQFALGTNWLFLDAWIKPGSFLRMQRLLGASPIRPRLVVLHLWTGFRTFVPCWGS
jgi:hypothetical protein